MLREGEPLAIEIGGAIRRGDADAVRQLIDAHPGLAAEFIASGKGSGRTPLHWAASSDDADVARVLIDGGADRLADLLSGSAPSADDINQAFFPACDGGQRRAAELLLARGADLNVAPAGPRLSAEPARGVTVAGPEPVPGRRQGAYYDLRPLRPFKRLFTISRVLPDPVRQHIKPGVRRRLAVGITDAVGARFRDCLAFIPFVFI